MSATVALVALALFFMQGPRQATPALGIGDDDDNNSKDASYSSAGVNPTYKAAAAATSLECHRDDDSPPPQETTATAKTVAVSVRLADKSSGRGIPDKQVIFTILPGNPVATLPTDASGQARISLNASEFNDGKPALFIFFDGDREYDFSSCRIDIVVAPQNPSGGPAAANS